MAHGIRIISPQQRAAAAAGIRVVLHHLIHPLDRQQLRATAGAARLATRLAATALAPLRRLKAGAVAGGRLGGIAGAAADPLLQLSQFRRQGGEVEPQLIVLQPMSPNLALLSQE
jgi:hypothetical protein